jgi:NDP-mannose synthase
MHAIVMAGGRGTRLGALAADRPKCLVNLDERHTILAVIVQQLRNHGFRRITLCVSHLADMVREALGNGSELGVLIDYQMDLAATGTAGPLLHVADYEAAALVINGDVLTTMNLAAMYQGHVHSGAALTIGAVQRVVHVEYGVLAVQGEQLLGLVEKPRFPLTVSAGVYAVSPGALKFLAFDRPSSMPDLAAALVAAGEPVRVHPIPETWFDIGTPQELDRARQLFATYPDSFLRSCEPLAGGARGDGPLAGAVGWR